MTIGSLKSVNASCYSPASPQNLLCSTSSTEHCLETHFSLTSYASKTLFLTDSLRMKAYIILEQSYSTGSTECLVYFLKKIVEIFTIALQSPKKRAFIPCGHIDKRRAKSTNIVYPFITEYSKCLPETQISHYFLTILTHNIGVQNPQEGSSL